MRRNSQHRKMRRYSVNYVDMLAFICVAMGVLFAWFTIGFLLGALYVM